ncbi:MAG TPA: thymidylate kinase [Candidatus Angelobacter sp.]
MATPLLISFSGMDGAGKSTQLENLRAALHAAGLSTRLLAFWDDVVVGAKYREGFVHKALGSERGVGAPGRPVNRRDKNVRAWYLNALRHFLYLLDALNLRRVLAREQRARVDVVIFDRYIYDELANLNLRNPLTRGYIRAVRAMVPRPHVAYLLDAEPDSARARKPEYPLAFLELSRRAYFELAALLGTMTIIPAQELAEAKSAVLKAAEQQLASTGRKVNLAGSLSAA